MTTIKHLALSIALALIGLCSLEIAASLPIPGGNQLASEARAIVGRPLTPVSVAGVARRTVRRCAVGVYYC
jgi:hypothetical protein